MASLLHLTREIQRHMDENLTDSAYIKFETKMHEIRIKPVKERIESRNNRIQKLQDHEFFVNVSDVMTECALEWGCQVKNLYVSAQIDRRFNLNTKESDVLNAAIVELNTVIIEIKYNNNLAHIRAFVREKDIHADGKTLQEHLFVIDGCDYKLVFCEKSENLIFRYDLSKLVDIKDGKVVARSEKDKLIARAIQRQAAREVEEKEERLAREAVIKTNSLLRLCPDCGGIISWCTHFQAFQHGSFGDCAYMEDKEGKRIWDNAMRKEKLIQEGSVNFDDENEKEC